MKLTKKKLNDSVKILEIQKEGKIRLSTEKFLIGNQIKRGENIV